MDARFFIAEIVRAIRDKTVLITSADSFLRDFIGPDDFYRLVSAILTSPATNDVVDCYSKGLVDKQDLLTAMQSHFGLQYQLVPTSVGINATGKKPYYYSQNKRALKFGYVPLFSSLDCLLLEMESTLLKPCP